MSERIALVGCVKSKRPGTHPARDLYISPLFTKRRAYVEAAGLPWWVLSAKHGLVAPNLPIHHYDQTLNRMGIAERRAWGERVLDQLRRELGDLGRYTVEIHAGSRYVDAIAPGLAEAGARIVVPTAHLGLGQQLAFYDKERRARP